MARWFTVIFVLVIAFSMAVNWADVASALPRAVVQPTSAVNPGIAGAGSFPPMATPQASISTIYQQYSLVDPSYQNGLNSIVFSTSFGQYIFSKTAPWMSFTYRDGTLLIQHSVFYVNSTFPNPITFSAYSINMSYLDNQHFSYSVNLNSGGSQVGMLRVSFIFDRVQRPKISILVTPTPTLSEHGFNVVWLVHGAAAYARWREAHAGFGFGNFTSGITPVAFNETRLELGLTAHPESWRVWAVVDWGDARVGAEVGFGEFPLLSYLNGPVSLVTFPANMSSIDPTVVGQSSVGYATQNSFQRHTFFDGVNYWAFYYNGSETIYQYSPDSRTWTSSAVTLWPYPATAVWFSGGNVYVLAGTSASGTTSATAYVYFKKGTISGHSITWGSAVTVDSDAYSDSKAIAVWVNYQDVNIVAGSDGLLTVIYTLMTESEYVSYYSVGLSPNTGCAPPLTFGSDRIGPGPTSCCQSCAHYSYSGVRSLVVRKSIDVNGASWGSAVTIASDGNYLNQYLSVLSQLANGAVLEAYEDNVNGTIKYSLSSAWTASTDLDAGPAGVVHFGSAVSNAAYHVNFVYMGSDNSVKYRSYNGTWSSAVTVASATSVSPSVSLGVGNDLYVMYINNGLVYVVQYSSFSGWGSPQTPLGTSFNAPGYLSAGSNSTNGFLVALWTEGTAAPYSVKLSSLPIEQAWSPYSVPSAPWDEEGVIPYGLYFKNLQEYVNPFTGLLTVVQSDFSVPGRGLSAVFTRVFRTPYTFEGATPYGFESYPYANLGLGWSLDWPWLGQNYLHLSDGQGYKIVFTGGVFENHEGEQFRLLQNSNGTYSLYDASGDAYLFNSAKQLTRITDPTGGNQMSFTYDSSNRMSQILDMVGRTITLTYNSNSQLASVSSGGRVWAYAYNSAGNLVSVTDPLGRVTSYQYTSTFSGWLLTQVTYPTHAYSNFTYGQALIGTETQSYEVSKQGVYLQGGTLVRQVGYAYSSATGGSVSTLKFSNATATQGYLNYTFTTSSATTVTENAQAQPVWETVDQYNGNGQISQHTIYPGVSTVSYTDYYGYDNWGNTVYQRLPITPTTYRESYASYGNTNTMNEYVNYTGGVVSGFTNSFYSNSLNPTIHDLLVGEAGYQNGRGSNATEAYYQYDAVGDLLQEKQLLGSGWLSTSRTYDQYGNPLSMTDAKGNVTTYQYSSTYQAAYLTQVSNVVNSVTLSTMYAYNFTTGDRLSVTDPEGNTTSYSYDMLDRPTSVTWPAVGGVRAERRNVYDDVNNIASVYDENGNYVKYLYDGLGRLTQTEAFMNNAIYATTQTSYYWNDRPRTVTDQTGNVTSYTYDFLGRELTATNPDGTFKQWTYNDPAGEVTAMDEKLHPTSYYYDWAGRLVAVTEFISGQGYNTTYAYDAVGNLLQVTDSKGQITTYAYDNLNRLVKTTFPDATTERRTYDNDGNLATRLTQNSSLIQYSYDQINRVTKITYPGGSSVSFIYDKNSNRLGMQDSSGTTTYTYDPRNRLLSEARSIGSVQYAFSYQYDAASSLIQLTYPDGYRLNYTYDQLNRVTSVGPLASFIYRLNGEVSLTTYGNGVKTSYSYDKLGRVTSIRTSNSTSTLLSLSYAYDPNGNPTSVNGGQELYSYDDLNRLLTGSGGFGTVSYTYDQVGNRLTATVNGTQTTYTYGGYNKLLTAGSTSYTYDPNGNMVTKTSGSNSWSYSYDYENRLKQASLNGVTVLQATYDGDGRRVKTVAGDTTVYDYLPGSWNPAYVKDLTINKATDIIFAGGLLVGKVQGAATSYYHLDRLGSVRLVTQQSNAASFQTSYQPYGSLSGTSGTETFQFTGKQLDSATGLYYYGLRYYDSQSGRFITQDPMPANQENPQSLNRYTYALDNPNAYTDPTGADFDSTYNKYGNANPDEFIAKLMRAGYSLRQARGMVGGDVSMQDAIKAMQAFKASQALAALRQLLPLHRQLTNGAANDLGTFDQLTTGEANDITPISKAATNSFTPSFLVRYPHNPISPPVNSPIISRWGYSFYSPWHLSPAPSVQWTTRQQWGAIDIVVGSAEVVGGFALATLGPFAIPELAPAEVAYGITLVNYGAGVIRSGIGLLTTPN